MQAYSVREVTLDLRVFVCCLGRLGDDTVGRGIVTLVSKLTDSYGLLKHF